jgi:hypothetical protein
MQEYTTEKNEINSNIAAGSYIPTILWQRTKDLEKLTEKYKKQQEKYFLAKEQDEKNALTVSTAPKE